MIWKFFFNTEVILCEFMIFAMIILFRGVNWGMGRGVGGGSFVEQAFILSFSLFFLYTGGFQLKVAECEAHVISFSENTVADIRLQPLDSFLLPGNSGHLALFPSFVVMCTGPSKNADNIQTQAWPNKAGNKHHPSQLQHKGKCGIVQSKGVWASPRW